MTGFEIYAATCGGYYASDVRVRLTAWGETLLDAVEALKDARDEFPKGLPDRCWAKNAPGRAKLYAT